MTARHFKILLFLFLPLLSNGQTIKLKKNIKLDTVYVSLQFSETIDEKLRNELSFQFDSIISVFNRNENSYFLKQKDSTINFHSLIFLVGPIKYVDWKKNLWVTGMDLALIGANILILPYFPPVIPFYFMPATVSKVEIDTQQDLLIKPKKLFINPNGYLTKKEKQTLRFKKKFNKVFYNFFNELSEQNNKNNKP